MGDDDRDEPEDDAGDVADDAGGVAEGGDVADDAGGVAEGGDVADDSTDVAEAGESDAAGGPTDDERTERDDGDGPNGDGSNGDGPDPDALREEIEELRAELEDFEGDVEDRTLHRDDVERDLKRYVRRRVRRGKARGWGPYVVLLYGTAMTLGAFYTPFLSGGWAIFAMIVIWLSTLGLYVLMLIVGLGVSLVSVPGRVRDAVGNWRS